MYNMFDPIFPKCNYIKVHIIYSKNYDYVILIVFLIFLLENYWVFFTLWGRIVYQIFCNFPMSEFSRIFLNYLIIINNRTVITVCLYSKKLNVKKSFVPPRPRRIPKTCQSYIIWIHLTMTFHFSVESRISVLHYLK